MPFCPSCGAAYREQTTECRTCHVPLTDSVPEVLLPPGEIRWTNVYEGSGLTLRAVEESLRGRGFDVIRLPGTAKEMYAVPVGRQPEQVVHRLAIPEVQFESRQVDVEAAIAAGTLSEENEDAIREAEEDYDVRGCPRCLLFFHENYTVCPGCNVELVPAVECFEEGQSEPDRVIVGHGTQAEVKALEAKLRAVGLDAQSFEVEDWPIDVVDLSWSELTDRTADAEAALGLS